MKFALAAATLLAGVALGAPAYAATADDAK